ncbi:type VI secretion system protein ImpL [Gammaproteobacteria bacterium]
MKWPIKIRQKKESQQAEQELKILEGDIAAAYNFLRKNRNSHFAGKKKIPLYLLLGPSRFGKTTLLAQAGLNLKNFNHQSLNHVTPTKYCSFWFSPDALYIDTAGTYTKPEITKPRNDLIWQGFIKLLQKYFGKHAISGALIILDLPAIAQDVTLLKKTLFCIRERIYELTTFIKTLPLHIVFTKCDHIAGFTEFFSLLTTEERSQPFGIAFTNNQERTDPVPVFEIKFNELLKHVNERVIERLQKSTHRDERLLIKTFPSQLGQLNQTILEVLSKIPSGQQISLSGIYFTSSIQSGIPVDILKNALLHAFNFKEKQTYKLEASNNYRYFIEDIFTKVITTTKRPKQWHLPKIRLHPNYLYALLTAGAIIGASCFIGYKSYYKNIETINEMQHLLQNQATTVNLDNLHVDLNKFDQDSQSWWLKLGVNETKLLLHSLHHTYQISLLQTLVAQLENNISTAITGAELKSTPQKLYSTLQAYLMLGDPKKLDASYIKNWFSSYWSDIYKDNSAEQTKLKQQLETALKYPFKVELNQQIIATAREHLNNLPPAPLMYLILENIYSNQTIDVGSIKPISKIYTSEYFNKIYQKEIPELINKLPQQDWVLGDHLQLQLKANADSATIKNIRDLYVENYVSAWETAVLNPEIKIDPKNLRTATEDLKTLATSKSPLIRLLQQIKTNTAIKNAPTSFTDAVKAKLQIYNVINLADLQHALNNLAHNFNTIAQNSDPSQAAFDVVINHLQNEHLDFLTNLQTFANYQSLTQQIWLQTIIKNSLSVLLEAASNHINKVWHSTIIPQYQKMLLNKYPLFKESKEDISLNNFNDFFGPHGLIDRFFNQYIKPFVVIDKASWTWKNIDGQQINFSQDSLEVFLRAALIQKMFYTNKTPNPKIYFTLAPMEIAPNTQSFTLHLEGQKVIFTSEDKQTYNLAWPGPNPGLVTIDFVNHQGNYFNASQFGPWAWFRIIDKSNLVSVNNTKAFTLTFDLNGNAAKYELSTNEPINPFIPEIINNFRCPDQLY